MANSELRLDWLEAKWRVAHRGYVPYAPLLIRGLRFHHAFGSTAMPGKNR